MNNVFTHIPVLPKQTVELLLQANGGHPKRIVDGTLGCGGHSALLLKASPELEILGIDRDSEALARSAERLAFAGSRVRLVKGTFSEIGNKMKEAGWEKADGILLDIGVSSPQIDDPARGFTFRNDGPLDMRMDQSNELTAARVLNRYSQSELERVFVDYGEIRRNEARFLAEAIIRFREKNAFDRTSQFAEVCEKTLRPIRRGMPPSPTLAFQALRIEVNDELNQLQKALAQTPSLLNDGGRLCVISFHSLEDRIVKNFMRDMAVACKCPPGLPVCVCGWKPLFTIITKHPVTAEPDELKENKRAACAKLRAAEKIKPGEQKK